jgi:hypothetical protein
MAEAAFALTYEGDALAEGRMPVRDLAPALLALGEIFADASSLVAPGRPPAALDIQATNKGSFEVHLILAGWDHIIDIFSSRDATALVTLKESIIGVGGLFALIKELHKRKVAKVEEAPDPGDVKLSFEDGTALTVPKAAWELYGNVEIRKKTKKVVEPVAQGSADHLIFHEDSTVTVRVGAADTDAFEQLPPTPLALPLGAHETELIVSIVSVAFKEDNKWRFSDGNRTFYAAIRDEAFLRGVENGVEAFRSGDMLRCTIRVVQSSDADGLHTEYEVLAVLEHIPRPSLPQLAIRLPDDFSLPERAENMDNPKEIGPGSSDEDEDN